MLELMRQTGKSQSAKIRTTPGTKNVKLPAVITEKQFSPAKRNTAVEQSSNSAHKEQMSEIEKYSDTCADTESKYLHGTSRKCLRSSKLLSNRTNNLRDSLEKENCNESVLNNVVEKLKPALSHKTCGYRNENNCTHSVGKSSNASKLSRNANEPMFSCEDIEGVDKSKCYISTEMTSSSDLSYTSDQINKSAETPASISTRNKTLNSQSCVNKTTDQNSNNHSNTPQRLNKTPKKHDRSLMNSKVDEKCQNVLKSVGTGTKTSISDHKEDLIETQNLLGQKVLSEPVYSHPRQVNHQKRLRNKLLQKQMKANEPIEIKTDKGRIMLNIGPKAYETLIDTGASMNVISEDAVENNPYLTKLKKLPTFYEKAETASGEKTISFLYLVESEIKIHGQIFKVPFHVANCLSPQVILGTPFFQRSHAILDYTNNDLTVTFNNGLYASNDVSVPAKSQSLVECHPRCNRINAGRFMTTGHFYKNFRSCLVGGRAIQSFTANQRNEPTFRVLLLNTTRKPIRIHRNVRLGYFTILGAEDNIIDMSDMFPSRELAKNFKSSDTDPPHIHKISDTFPTNNGNTVGENNTFPPIQHDLSHCTTLNDDEKQKLANLLLKYDKAFLHDGQALTRTNVLKHKIRVPDDPSVWPSRRLRLNPTKMEIVQKCTKDLLEQDIIRYSDSKYDNPIVLVHKKDNKQYRLCLDLTFLNKNIAPDALIPLPLSDILEYVKKPKFLTSLDLSSSFWQVELEEEDKQYTAFYIPGVGKVESNVMAMGEKNATSTMTRLLNIVMDGLIGHSLCCFVDDILLHSSTFEEHLQTLEEVFQRLIRANLTLKPSKCIFCTPEIHFLGHVISQEGIKPEMDKIEVIKNFPVPNSVKKLRRFLGCCGFYRKYVKGFGQIADPLYKLLAKDQKFDFSDDCLDAFETLKEKLITAPVLQLPDYSKDFYLFTDCSDVAAGYSLNQKGGNGQYHAISYGSKKLNKHQKNMTITEKECLALCLGVNYYRKYLLGHKVICVVDHMPLKYLIQQPLNDSRTARWLATLNEYDIHVVYKPGPTNTVADALSRIEPVPLTSISAERLDEMFRKQCFPQTFHHEFMSKQSQTEANCSPQKCQQTQTDQICSPLKPLHKAIVHKISGQLKDISTPKEELIHLQKSDPAIKPIVDYMTEGVLPTDDKKAREIVILSEFYHFNEGVLYRASLVNYSKNHKRHMDTLVIPSALQMTIIRQTHDLGHPGITKTCSTIRSKYYIPKLRQLVSDYIKSCKTCGATKETLSKHQQNISPNPVAEDLLESWSFDIKGPCECGEQGNSYKYILVCIENFSKYIELFPLPKTDSETIASCIYHGILLRYGTPKRIFSDNARNLTSEVIQSLNKLMGTKHFKSLPYAPFTNGMAEKAVQVVATHLKKLLIDRPKDWNNFLPIIMFSHNNMINLATGFSPNFLIYGREIPNLFDVTYKTQSELPPAAQTSDIIRHIFENRELAKAIIRENSDKYRENMRKQANKGKNPFIFHVGQAVYVRIQNFDRTKSRAIQPIWAGPFYVVEDNDSHVKVSKTPFGQPLKTLLHKNLIKPYHFRNIPEQPEPMAITDIDSNERHLFQNSEYVQKQGQGNQTNKQTISAQSETDKTPKIYNKDETHPKDTETLPNETRKSLSNESGKVDNGKSQSKAKDTEIHENRKQILTKYGEIIAKKYFGKDLHILFSKPEIKQETWLHLKDLEPWYSSKCQEIQKLPWVTSFSRIVTKTNQ